MEPGPASPERKPSRFRTPGWRVGIAVFVGLVLIFVPPLAFAEVTGFAPAYMVASAAIIGLVTAYSAAILGGWRRAAVVGSVLALLYGVLYVLLGLEEYALLIGSVLLFVALAITMYLSRRIDWDGGAAAGLTPARAGPPPLDHGITG